MQPLSMRKTFFFLFIQFTTLTCTHYQNHLNYSNGLKNFISAFNSQSIIIVIPKKRLSFGEIDGYAICYKYASEIFLHHCHRYLKKDTTLKQANSIAFI